MLLEFGQWWRGSCLLAGLGVLPAIGWAETTAIPSEVDVFVGDKMPDKPAKEGYHTFRIPALVQATNGDLLAICEGRRDGDVDHGKIDLVLKRSSDGGKTWGNLQVIYGEADTITIGNPVPIVDRQSGSIHLLFCKNNRAAVMITHSHDNGNTWSPPTMLKLLGNDPPKGSKTLPPTGFAALTKAFGRDVQTFGTGPGHGIQLVGGRLVAPIWLRGMPVGQPLPQLDPNILLAEQLSLVDKREPNVRLFAGLLISDDSGETWHAGGVTVQGANESSVAELPDGSVVSNSRFEPCGTYRVVARSKDHGETFTDFTLDRNLIDVKCQGSLASWRQGDGKTHLAFLNPAVKGIGYNRRAKLTLRLSADGGVTWPVAREIEPGMAAYSDLCALQNGNLGLLFERGKNDYRDRITFVMLSPDLFVGKLPK